MPAHIFTLYSDKTLTEDGQYLAVPGALVEMCLNNATTGDSRISESGGIVYLAQKDIEAFLDQMHRRHIQFEITHIDSNKPSFIRALSPLAWQ
jgi:hypothetical protein